MSRIITVDFDHTLLFEDGITPNMKTLEILWQEHMRDRIIIVTARRWSIDSAQQIHKFAKQHGFYWENVIHTDLRPKGPICRMFGSTKHFDDCPTELQSCRQMGIPVVDCFDGKKWAEMYPDPHDDWRNWNGNSDSK